MPFSPVSLISPNNNLVEELLYYNISQKADREGVFTALLQGRPFLYLKERTSCLTRGSIPDHRYANPRMPTLVFRIPVSDQPKWVEQDQVKERIPFYRLINPLPKELESDPYVQDWYPAAKMEPGGQGRDLELSSIVYLPSYYCIGAIMYRKNRPHPLTEIAVPTGVRFDNRLPLNHCGIMPADILAAMTSFHLSHLPEEPFTGEQTACSPRDIPLLVQVS